VKPSARAPRHDESTTRQRELRSGITSRFRPRVLVVDDSEDNRELCAALLARRGYEVATACDGEEAVEKAVALRPHVIVMDVAMPTMDGWEATRRIRANASTSAIYIIVLTAFGDAESRRQSFAAGCNEHVVKPAEDLVERIGMAFAGLRDAS